MRLKHHVIRLGILSLTACWSAESIAQELTKPSTSIVESAAAAPSEQGQVWRYKHHQGRWWYWLPSNSWVYWQDSQWVRYDADRFDQRIPPRDSSQRYRAGYRGMEVSAEERHWPHGANGSDPTASSRPGAAALHANGAGVDHSMSEHWPHGANGSDTTASSQAGGAGIQRGETRSIRRYSRSESQQAAEDEYYKWRNN
jgi:hypothetical protein